jgi:hypothetical protein
MSDSHDEIRARDQARDQTAKHGSPLLRSSASGSATLTFRGGGWVIVLAGILVLLLLGWSLLGPMLGRHPIGDGKTVASYGFDLSTNLLPTDALRASGFPRGFLPSRDDPTHLRGSEMLVFNERNRPKYVVTTDRVVGIEINGQAHAWPLTLLNVHEVVNDTVAGVPVAVTYSPLCDSVVVFDRRVAGVTRLFELSGLLFNSNLVFCDKSAEGVDPLLHQPSLFVQLERRAIAGPLATAGVTLEPLPNVVITTWADWLSTHPDTTVCERDAGAVRRMKEISYARYFLTPKLEYPVAPLPDEASLARDELRLKSPVLALRVSEGWKFLAFEQLIPLLGPDRSHRLTIEGVEYVLHLPSGPAVARLERVDGAPVTVIPCLWFAASALIAPHEQTSLLKR